MGKGDRKTRRGKIRKRSSGKTRPKHGGKQRSAPKAPAAPSRA
jgi:ribosomal small subunit protein bTHX